MTKRFLPLGIALGIHICVFLISGFFIKEKNTEFVSSKNLIDVQFGSGSNAHQKKSNSSKQPVRFLQKISESPEMNANIPNKNLEHMKD